VDFVAIKLPASGIAAGGPREPFELGGIRFGAGVAGKFLQIVPN